MNHNADETETGMPMNRTYVRLLWRGHAAQKFARTRCCVIGVANALAQRLRNARRRTCPKLVNPRIHQRAMECGEAD